MSIVATAPCAAGRSHFPRRRVAVIRWVHTLSGLRIGVSERTSTAVSRGLRSTSLRLTRRGRFVLLGLPVLSALAAFVALALIAVTPGTAAAGSGSEGSPVRQVKVAAGDTLWEVAAEADPGSDTRDVMVEIAELNGLRDSSIAPGQTLVVPVPSR